MDLDEVHIVRAGGACVWGLWARGRPRGVDVRMCRDGIRAHTGYDVRYSYAPAGRRPVLEEAKAVEDSFAKVFEWSS